MVASHDGVMVVEDEPEARDYLTQLLRLEGFQVVACSNGAEALDYLAHSAPPCLIIFDMRMPVMDGVQFRSAMLRDYRLAKIPVIIVTAFEPHAAMNLSPLRVFRKPVDFNAMLDTLRANC